MPKVKAGDSFLTLSRLIKTLPFITIKKYSKYYLVPHKPYRPVYYKFNLSAALIKSHSQKYYRYYSPQNIQAKTKQILINAISDLEVKNLKQRYEKQFEQKMKQHAKKLQQYDQKYLQPLVLMRTQPFQIFRYEQMRKNRQISPQTQINNEKINSNLNQQNEKNISADLQVFKNEKQIKRDKILSHKKKPLSGLQKVNKMNLGKVWSEMTQERKQVYFDKAQKIKSQNKQRIQQFVQNHQVPVLKQYRPISRYISKYASLYQLKLSDKKLYDKYRQIPQSQKQEFKEQARQMSLQSKQKYFNFLKKWKLSKQQLNNIIQVCNQYKKQYSDIKKNVRKEYSEDQGHFGIQQEDETTDDS